MAKPKSPSTSIPKDSAQSEAAHALLRAELEALAASAIQPRRAQVVPIVGEALRIAEDINKPEARARFALLPKELFDSRYLVTLGQAALALYWAHTQWLSASSQSTEAKLPTKLVASATTRKRRMLKVLNHHLGEDEAVARELADIVTGVGYEDLAIDLMRLAKLYRDHHDDVAMDGRYFQADDESLARKEAETITAQLRAADGSAAATWSDQVARAWTLLNDTYELEVRPAAVFVFRKDEDVDARFPSLVGVTRNVSAEREDEPAEPVNPDAPAGGGKDEPKK